MMRIFPKLVLCLLVLAVVAVQPAGATSMPAFSVPQLAKRADMVVVAVARAMHSRWRGPLIVTDVELQIEEVIRGQGTVGNTLVVTIPGGDIERLALTIPGAPRFAVGQRTVSFLRKAQESDNSPNFTVVGMAQGSLAVVGTGSNARVMGSAAAAHTVTRQHDGTLTAAKPTIGRPMSLAELRNQVQLLPRP